MALPTDSSGRKYVPATHHKCGQHVELLVDELVLEGNELDGFCPACGHGVWMSNVPTRWVYALRINGIHSLADECALFLATRRTDIL